MDSKARHELEKNELAKYISAAYEDWIKPNSSWLGYAVLGALIITAIVYGTIRVDTWNRQAAWKQYYAAVNSPAAMQELEMIADSTASIVGVHARLTLAQRQLDEGCTLLMTGEKAEAVILLEKAVSSFQQVQSSASEPGMQQQAGFGLGQAWETLSATRVGDDLAQAESAYKNVADNWADSFLGRQAQRQLTLVSQPATRQFLERMAARVLVVPELDEFRAALDFDAPLEGSGSFDFSIFEQDTLIEPDDADDIEDDIASEGTESEE